MAWVRVEAYQVRVIAAGQMQRGPKHELGAALVAEMDQDRFVRHHVRQPPCAILFSIGQLWLLHP